MSPVLRNKENNSIKKRISVSQKRQVTIPIEFFNMIGIEKEVECYIENDAIVIRPIRESSGEFDEQILADLISQGLAGEELLIQFKEMRKKIRPAVISLITEATLAASNNSEHFSYEDIFNSETE